jgi:hypothetical protein
MRSVIIFAGTHQQVWAHTTTARFGSKVDAGESIPCQGCTQVNMCLSALLLQGTLEVLHDVHADSQGLTNLDDIYNYIV